MLRRPGPSTAVLALVAHLVGGLAAVLPLNSASGVGSGDPQIVSPSGTEPLYEGFTGPYVVSFASAPAGDYSYRVQPTPSGQAPIEGALTTDGVGKKSFSLAALPPGEAYTFVIEDGATGDHRAEVTFEVRAGAQPRCFVGVPSALRVDTAEEVVTGRLSSNCAAAQVQYASWDVKDVVRGTYINSLQYGPGTQDQWKFFDSQPLGVYALKPVDSINAAGDDIVQNTPRTEVRFDSRLSLSGSRDGSRVTLRISARKYSRDANGFVPWRERAVALSYRNCTACPWTYLRSVATGTSGSTSYRFTASAARTYRVAASGTSTYWAPYARYLRL